MVRTTINYIGVITILTNATICALPVQAKTLKSGNLSKFHNCVEINEDTEKLCDISNNESAPVFHSPPVLPSSIQLDVRPENCLSFFDDYLHTRRGLRIESALALSDFYAKYANTVSNFPTVDFIANGHIRVVKTRDLMVDSFNNANNNESLFDQIMQDAADIHDRFLTRLQSENEISATNNGVTTSIASKDVLSVTLDIVIQSGIASESQVSQINRAIKELAKRWGFKLQVIEIP